MRVLNFILSTSLLLFFVGCGNKLSTPTDKVSGAGGGNSGGGSNVASRSSVCEIETARVLAQDESLIAIRIAFQTTKNFAPTAIQLGLEKIKLDATIQKVVCTSSSGKSYLTALVPFTTQASPASVSLQVEDSTQRMLSSCQADRVAEENPFEVLGESCRFLLGETEQDQPTLSISQFGTAARFALATNSNTPRSQIGIFDAGNGKRVPVILKDRSQPRVTDTYVFGEYSESLASGPRRARLMVIDAEGRRKFTQLDFKLVDSGSPTMQAFKENSFGGYSPAAELPIAPKKYAPEDLVVVGTEDSDEIRAWHPISGKNVIITHAFPLLAPKDREKGVRPTLGMLEMGGNLQIVASQNKGERLSVIDGASGTVKQTLDLSQHLDNYNKGKKASEKFDKVDRLKSDGARTAILYELGQAKVLFASRTESVAELRIVGNEIQMKKRLDSPLGDDDTRIAALGESYIVAAEKNNDESRWFYGGSDVVQQEGTAPHLALGYDAPSEKKTTLFASLKGKSNSVKILVYQTGKANPTSIDVPGTAKDGAPLGAGDFNQDGISDFVTITQNSGGQTEWHLYDGKTLSPMPHRLPLASSKFSFSGFIEPR